MTTTHALAETSHTKPTSEGARDAEVDAEVLREVPEVDPGVVASVMVESGILHAGGGGGVRAVSVSPLNADLLGATVRLVRLIDRPSEYRAIAPLVVREIVYRLLTGPQGSRMRHLAT